MAIEPKSPRKRAVKKVSKKKSLAADTSTETVDTSVAEATESKSKKRAPAIPVSIFQAATTEKAPKAARKSAVKDVAAKNATEGAAPDEGAAPADDEDSRGGRNRRRRRGGRGRRKPSVDGVDSSELNEDGDESSSEAVDEGAEGATHRRRRRRRATGEGVTPGEIVDEDGVITVVKVREVRERTERPTRSERTERGTRNRRERSGRSDRSDNRGEYREPYRRRGTVITDGEFLARRENVDREMLVRQIGDRIQIAVIEDKVMVEHYVNRNANVSYVGNVYLGRVQNVLPSMEAAFVDIGKGRNAVLYAGEVNWDAAGISESQPRKIEMVLKTGQPVLVQVTKDP
ncbi:MAG: ribonuclease E/G, partial [Actinomycetota bacterium]|nr:ribonuclease E/G [Actinomycetota bacterium]